MYRARDGISGRMVAERLRAAHTHWTRLRGLLGTSGLAAGDGLWIRPCRQVHMFGMRYPIDVLFLDDGLGVVHAIADLGPGRVSPRVVRTAIVGARSTHARARVASAGSRLTRLGRAGPRYDSSSGSPAA